MSRDVGNSLSRASSLLRDLIERPRVAVKRGFFPGQLLPALDDDVDVLRIKLDAVADAFR
jgi:hypothetical protein